MKFCVPLIIGIVVGWQWTFPLWLAAILAVAGFLVLSFPSLLGTRSAASYSPLITFVVILLFGIFKITFDAGYVSEENIANFVSPGKIIRLKGKVTDLPSASRQSIRFGIGAEHITVAEREYETSGGVLISVRLNEVTSGLTDSLTYGREVTLTGELLSPGIARNPGEFDLRRYLYLNDIFAQLYMGKSDSIILGAKARNNLLALYVFPVRRSASNRLDRFIGGEEGNFLKGLIIGERSEISPEVKTAFINTGVMHIIAVSGLHVAIVVLILLVLFQLMRIPEKPRIVITCLLLVYYIFLTGAAASVARSVVMAIIFLSAKLLERKTDVYNTLALSAIVLLMIDSKQLFQAGFQLSFVAVFSLVYLYPKIYALKEYLPELWRANRIVILLFASLAVSLAAGIGTLPFTSLYFGKISIVSFVANMVIVPLSNVILALGMLTVAVSYASAWLASAYAEVTSILTCLLLKLVKIFGDLPFSYIESHFTVWSSIVFYGAVGAVINFRRKELRKYFLIAGLITVNLWFYTSMVFLSTSHILRATFLDVGQGDAIFLEFPDGRKVLIDGGSRTYNADAGERFIGPFLGRQGIHRLDAVLVTHPHSDHLGGIPYILQHFNVDEVIDAGSLARSSLQREYLHIVDSLRLVHKIVRAGTTLEGFWDVRVFVLHPSDEFVSVDSTQHVNFNNQSVVLKIQYGETSLLLVGDAEREVEDHIIRKYGDFIHSDILKAGHHGSITSSSPLFLNLVHPAMAVVSVGAKNKFRHPSAVVLDRFSRGGCKYFRTDELGAVIMESDGKSWSFLHWQ